MFHGSIPADLRSIIYEHAESWPDTDLYVGCSGNFTIERTLHSRPGEWRAIHGNDVQSYWSALGWWLAGRGLDYRLKEEHAEELAWLEPYLGTSTDTLATLMLGTRFLQYVGRSGVYYERMVRATVGQFPTMHAKTVAKLSALMLRLADYYCGDVRDYLRDVVPADAPVAMFPPFYCLAPEERLLTEDLRWVPCGELRPGDRLLAFDEYPPAGMRVRRWRRSAVTRSEPAVQECVRVHLADGTSVVCTADHPWLADQYDGKSGGKRRWVRADELLEKAPYVLRLLDTWDEARTYEAGWLAGMFDGEGSIHVGQASKLQLAQRPGPTASKVVDLLKLHGFDAGASLRPSGVLGIEVAGGFPTILRALGTLRPDRLISRLAALDIEQMSVRSRGNCRIRVVAVESLGERPIQSITTTTGTYIGEGFAMHNTGDYEAQFAGIDEFFDWPAPSYDMLDEDGKEEIIGAVLDRPYWILGLHIARDELRPWLRGVVQTSNRGMPIFVYASSGARRVVAPAQQVAPILPPKFDPSTAYLMSDFPVSWTRTGG